MEKEKNNKGEYVVVIILLILGAFIFGTLSQDNSNQPETKTKIEATSLRVTKFYDGEWGYSLSIPEANSSTCVWTWVAGSGSIPNSKTTSVFRNATDKHFVKFGDYIDAQWDYKVSCVDDFGDQYTGVFPVEK